MSGNIFGEIFKVATFGESHGAGLGCIIDGCPAGISVDEKFLQHEMERRKPHFRDRRLQGQFRRNGEKKHCYS